MFVSAVLPCMRAMAASITVDTTHYVPDSLAHAAMGAGSQAFWLLEPGIGARRRVARFMLIRASSATLAVGAYYYRVRLRGSKWSPPSRQPAVDPPLRAGAAGQ